MEIQTTWQDQVKRLAGHATTQINHYVEIEVFYVRFDLFEEQSVIAFVKSLLLLFHYEEQ